MPVVFNGLNRNGSPLDCICLILFAFLVPLCVLIPHSHPLFFIPLLDSFFSMQVNGKNYHTIWVHPDNNKIIQVIDQRKLPFEFQVLDLMSATDTFEAIQNMTVRGAPLIGVTGAYGVYLGLVNSEDDTWKTALIRNAGYLKSARPTAVNLALLIDELLSKLVNCISLEQACNISFQEANRMRNREIEWSEAIGDYGCELIEAISKNKNGAPVNILTHCNAG